MTRYALDERDELAASLRAAGPDAPTLCGDWNTAQLAGHLLLRERSAVEVLGRVPSPRARGVAQRHLDSLVAERPFEQLVAQFQVGPPRWSPFAIPAVREQINLLEYVIHHEDVRRGAGPVPARELPAARVAAIWQRLGVAARLTLRLMPTGIELVAPGHGTIRVRRRERPTVRSTGDPVELALVAFGRQAAADVSYDGAPADVLAVRSADVAI